MNGIYNHIIYVTSVNVLIKSVETLQIPEFYVRFSNSSNIVSLTNSLEENGKWLLIGFNIDKITNLMNIINNIKFYIDNNE